MIISRMSGFKLQNWIENVKDLLILGDINPNYKEKYINNQNNNQTNHDNNISLSSISNNESISLLQSTKLWIDNLLKDIEIENNLDQALYQKLISKQNEIKENEYLFNTENVSNLMNKLEKYREIQLQIQLLKLIKAMYQLKNYQHVQDIPLLVFNIFEDKSTILLSHSRIYKFVKETIKDIKIILLKNFHQLFEEHLIETQSTNTITDNDEDKMKHNRSNLWNIFISQARDWLLAYALVSITPILLSEGVNLVLDHFQDTMDEAFTPIWGRFHYHLEIARQAKSSMQLIWTFKYCKSFVQMMCDLTILMTSSGDLQRLCDLDYTRASIQQVIDKACKFMRAHIAITIVELSPFSPELCMQIIEETLELDDWFYTLSSNRSFSSILQTTTSIGTDQSSSTSSTSTKCSSSTSGSLLHHIHISPVLYESKETFHLWLSMEHMYFTQEIQRSCSRYEKIYQFQFNQLKEVSSSFNNMSIDVNDIINESNKNINANLWNSQYRCYESIYHCMNLFHTLCNRYIYLPENAQRIFAIVILESLLCTMLALFLYRIRTNRVLYMISLGTYKLHIRNVNDVLSIDYINKNYKEILPTEYLEFIDSIQYLVSCLQNIPTKLRSIYSRSSIQFRTKSWNIIQQWMPKIFITEVEYSNKNYNHKHYYGPTISQGQDKQQQQQQSLSLSIQGQVGPYCTMKLIEKIWGLSKEYFNDDINYKYRNHTHDEQLSAQDQSIVDNRVDIIGDCVDMTITLLITMNDVMIKQMKDNLNNLISKSTK